MSKDRRGNREAKKPKKAQPKPLVTAGATSGKDAPVIAGKKLK